METLQSTYERMYNCNDPIHSHICGSKDVLTDDQSGKITNTFLPVNEEEVEVAGTMVNNQAEIKSGESEGEGGDSFEEQFDISEGNPRVALV